MWVRLAIEIIVLQDDGALSNDRIFQNCFWAAWCDRC